MSETELIKASMERMKKETERLTRRNLKECVSEYVQTLCLSDPAFARMVMHPHKSMAHCLQYINRKAREYLLAETIRSWRGPGTIIKIESSREINGKTTYETRYYISDEIGLSASYFQKLIRGHRSIENQLHWHLDVTFKEDNCRARKGYSSQNLSVLRKVALHIVSEQKDKLSLKRRLYKAALDINYLRKLLGY